MKFYNLWLFLILLGVYSLGSAVEANTRALRHQNELLARALLRLQARQDTTLPRAAAWPRSWPSPLVVGWLRRGRLRHVGCYSSLAEVHLDYLRRTHPEQLPAYAR